MSGNARIAEVDVLRGLLAITVVLGHAVQQYETTIGGFWLAVKDFIYSFHMPAFVFISGFCAYRALGFSGDGQKAGFLKARARRLVVPYFAWGALYFILRALAGEHARVPYDCGKIGFFLLGYNPDGAMWFGWALFAAFVLTALGLRLVRGSWLLALTGLLSVVAPYFVPTVAIHTRALLSVHLYMFFILLGAEFCGWLVRHKNIGVVRVCLLMVGCAALFTVAYLLHISRIAYPMPWYCLTSVFAVFFLFGLSRVLVRKCRPLQPVLTLLGVEAMSIYVLGEPIKVMCRIAFSKAGIPLAVAFPVMLAFMFVLPIALARIIRRSVVLRQLLLGEFKARGVPRVL